MSHHFDQTFNRRDTQSAKWTLYKEDVLPMWVADMDFPAPQPVMDALHERVHHGIFGYCMAPPELPAALCERMKQLYDWEVTTEEIIFLPGLVAALNVMCRLAGKPGDGVLVNTPVYGPFLSSPGNQERVLHGAPLRATRSGSQICYEVDFEALEAAIQPSTKLFLLCNPHNPIGRAYTRDELAKFADLCERHDLLLCSDEIHADLVLAGAKHIPSASLSPEISRRTVTLMAPSKTFNLPGLGCGFAIIQDVELRRRFNEAMAGIVPHVNVFGYTGALAAYTHPDAAAWLDHLRGHLTENRDFLVNYIEQELPMLRTTVPEATYLAWIDCSEANIEGDLQKFFVEQAKVAFNPGPWFGEGGEGFVRLNFGCSRETLKEGLDRMKGALEAV